MGVSGSSRMRRKSLSLPDSPKSSILTLAVVVVYKATNLGVVGVGCGSCGGATWRQRTTPHTTMIRDQDEPLHSICQDDECRSQGGSGQGGIHDPQRKWNQKKKKH